MLIITSASCTDYHRQGHPERPQRITATVARLRAQTDLELDWMEPESDPDAAILLAHTRDQVERLAAPEEDFDADTPAHAGILDHARRGVSGALDAYRAALRGEKALSLLRPPGHHASTERAMGFCYLNQAAIVAVQAAAEGRRAAVIDFDVHHGNGTELVLMGRPETFYASVHQSPAYPGTGSMSRLNCCNRPVKPYADRSVFVAGFEEAFAAMMDFAPDLIVVSAGFDAYRGDPLAQENVEGEDFFGFGRLLRETGLPVASILEGGYSDDLPDLVLEYLKGLA